MKDLTLVVMAAGMGSRFGGLKQITPIDDAGNFIIDYSVYDAMKAGFNHVVFVINEENFKDFKETIGKRIEDKIKVDYAFQKKDDIPYEDKSIVDLRKKPWGTVQAVLASKEYVSGNFAVINADDYYGPDAYLQVVNFFKENKDNNHYVSIPYPFIKTASNKGAVKRGVCDIQDDIITKIIECSIEKVNSEIIASPLDGSKPFTIDANALVSMNMFGFTVQFFEILETFFADYFKQSKEDILNGECLLPDCLESYISRGEVIVHSRPTTSRWLGMTYKEDLLEVKQEIKKLIDENVYQKGLW